MDTQHEKKRRPARSLIRCLSFSPPIEALKLVPMYIVVPGGVVVLYRTLYILLSIYVGTIYRKKKKKAPVLRPARKRSLRSTMDGSTRGLNSTDKDRIIPRWGLQRHDSSYLYLYAQVCRKTFVKNYKIIQMVQSS